MPDPDRTRAERPDRRRPPATDGTHAPIAGAHRLAAMIGNRAFRSLARVIEPELTAEPLDLGDVDDPIVLAESVGRGGRNRPQDVAALRRGFARIRLEPGPGDAQLEALIVDYQHEVLGVERPDGRVDPDGRTLRAINSGQRQPVTSAPREPTQATGGRSTSTTVAETRTGATAAPASLDGARGIDFSADAAADTLPKLQTGDHVWYWHDPATGQGHAVAGGTIPKATWGLTADFVPHSKEVYNFVVYPDRVKCGQPQRAPENIKGSFAWLNNNPGNLTGATPIGQLPGKQNGAPPGTPFFAVFPDWKAGRDAIRAWLEKNGPARTSAYANAYKAKPGDPILAKEATRRAKYAGDIRYIDMTLLDAWTFYCPDASDRYPLAIAKDLGVNPETQMLSALTPAQWETLKDTVVRIEGTIPGWTYVPSDYGRLPAAIRAAL